MRTPSSIPHEQLSSPNYLHSFCVSSSRRTLTVFTSPKTFRRLHPFAQSILDPPPTPAKTHHQHLLDLLFLLFHAYDHRHHKTARTKPSKPSPPYYNFPLPQSPPIRIPTLLLCLKIPKDSHYTTTTAPTILPTNSIHNLPRLRPPLMPRWLISGPAGAPSGPSEKL